MQSGSTLSSKDATTGPELVTTTVEGVSITFLPPHSRVAMRLTVPSDHESIRSFSSSCALPDQASSQYAFAQITRILTKDDDWLKIVPNDVASRVKEALATADSKQCYLVLRGMETLQAGSLVAVDWSICLAEDIDSFDSRKGGPHQKRDPRPSRSRTLSNSGKEGIWWGSLAEIEKSDQ